jgi:hypothetical protein
MVDAGSGLFFAIDCSLILKAPLKSFKLRWCIFHLAINGTNGKLFSISLFLTSLNCREIEYEDSFIHLHMGLAKC